MPILVKFCFIFAAEIVPISQLILNFMVVYLLSYELLDPNETGVLSMYSNRHAAEEALSYAESLGKYFRLYIEKSFVQEKFFKTDFD